MSVHKSQCIGYILCSRVYEHLAQYPSFFLEIVFLNNYIKYINFTMFHEVQPRENVLERISVYKTQCIRFFLCVCVYVLLYKYRFNLVFMFCVFRRAPRPALFLKIKNGPCLLLKVKIAPCPFLEVKNAPCLFSEMKNKPCPFSTNSKVRKLDSCRKSENAT